MEHVSVLLVLPVWPRMPDSKPKPETVAELEDSNMYMVKRGVCERPDPVKRALGLSGCVWHKFWCSILKWIHCFELLQQELFREVLTNDYINSRCKTMKKLKDKGKKATLWFWTIFEYLVFWAVDRILSWLLWEVKGFPFLDKTGSQIDEKQACSDLYMER